MPALGLTPHELEAIGLSLRVATAATLVSLPFGIAVAWLLARGRFAGKLLVEATVMLPLVVPPVVTGYVLLLLLGHHGPIGRLLEGWFGITVAFNWKGAALASAVIAFPLLVRAVRVSFESADRGVEEAARTLGASRLRVFFGVSLPMALPGVLAGTALAFARSLGEFGATITFVGNIAGATRTLPLAIYGYTQQPGGETAAFRLVLVSVALSFAALGLSELSAARARRTLMAGHTRSRRG